MNGVVTATLEAVVELTVRGVGDVLVLAVIDTGFSGALLLPLEMIQRLALPMVSQTVAELGDGSEVVLDLYSGEVEWQGVWQVVRICAAANGALLGMELMKGSSLTVDIHVGGRVEILPLSKGRGLSG